VVNEYSKATLNRRVFQAQGGVLHREGQRVT
jgi:hypothetical protein